MPIADDKPTSPGPVVVPGHDAPTNNVPVRPIAKATSYGSTAIDLRYVPRQSLLTFIAGGSWTVTYYSRVVTNDTELGPQQVDQSAVFQQYIRIIDMEVKVTSGNQGTQDAQTKAWDVQGTATIFPGLIPNAGDMFSAVDMDGRHTLFVVNSSTKLSMFEDALYSIEYKQVGYMTDDRRADFDKKAVKTVYFVKNYLYEGRNPFLIDQDYNNAVNLSKVFQQLVNDYMQSFFSIEHQCLLVPGQVATTYDPFINNKVMAWVDQDMHPYLQRMRPKNVDQDLIFRSQTVLDAIQQMDASLLPLVQQQCIVASSGYLADYPQLDGIFWSGIKQVIYPKERRTDVDREHAGFSAPVYYGRLPNKGKPRYNTLQRLAPVNQLGDINDQPEAPHGLPDIVPVGTTTYYIFSENFYYPENGPLASKFEVMVSDALNGRAVNMEDLVRLSKAATKWYSLERFYYVPILLALIKVTLLKGS